VTFGRPQVRQVTVFQAGVVGATLGAGILMAFVAMLIGPTDAAELPGLTTEVQVVAFADRIGVAPGIVVGRMQHLELIAPNRWTNLIVRYRFADD